MWAVYVITAILYGYFVNNVIFPVPEWDALVECKIRNATYINYKTHYELCIDNIHGQTICENRVSKLHEKLVNHDNKGIPCIVKYNTIKEFHIGNEDARFLLKPLIFGYLFIGLLIYYEYDNIIKSAGACIGISVGSVALYIYMLLLNYYKVPDVNGILFSLGLLTHLFDILLCAWLADQHSEQLRKSKATEVKLETTEVKPVQTEVKPASTEVKPETTTVKPTSTEVKPETTTVKPETTSVKPTSTEVKPELNTDKAITQSDNCVICELPLDKKCGDVRYESLECPLYINKCGHKFHFHCVSQYAKLSGSCPRGDGKLFD